MGQILDPREDFIGWLSFFGHRSFGVFLLVFDFNILT